MLFSFEDRFLATTNGLVGVCVWIYKDTYKNVHMIEPPIISTHQIICPIRSGSGTCRLCHWPPFLPNYILSSKWSSNLPAALRCFACVGCLTSMIAHLLGVIRHFQWDPQRLRLCLSTGDNKLYMWSPEGCSIVDIPADEGPLIHHPQTLIALKNSSIACLRSLSRHASTHVCAAQNVQILLFEELLGTPMATRCFCKGKMGIHTHQNCHKHSEFANHEQKILTLA